MKGFTGIRGDILKLYNKYCEFLKSREKERTLQAKYSIIDNYTDISPI